MEYVAIWFGRDGRLGRTLKRDTMESAIEAGIELARENQHVLTSGDLESGSYFFNDGSSLHIGSLES